MILTGEQLKNFWSDGYVVVKGCFDAEEIGGLRDAPRSDRELDTHSFEREDGEGGTVRLSMWNHPGERIYGAFARCRRIVDSMEKILGGKVYQYHSKMILKNPKVGGAGTWHQDYGYWYHNSYSLPLWPVLSLRWVMVCCSNAARNDPFADSQHPRYTPIHKVEDSALRGMGIRTVQATGGDAVGWLEKDLDDTARKLQPGVRELDKQH